MSYQCTVCTQKFTYKGNFAKHCANKHGLVVQFQDEHNAGQAAPSAATSQSSEPNSSSRRYKRFRSEPTNAAAAAVQVAPVVYAPVASVPATDESVDGLMEKNDRQATGQLQQLQVQDSCAYSAQSSRISPPVPIKRMTVYNCTLQNCTFSFTKMSKLVNHQHKHFNECASIIDRLKSSESAKSTDVTPPVATCSSDAADVQIVFDSSQQQQQNVSENADDHNPSIETTNPMDTAAMAMDSGAPLTEASDGADLVGQSKPNVNLDKANMAKDVEMKSPIGAKSTRMNLNEKQEKLESLAKWIRQLVKRFDGTVNLEKVYAYFKELEGLISELDDVQQADHWFEQKTLIWNEISKLEDKLAELKIDKKLDWVAIEMEQLLSKHSLSSADWTDLKRQSEKFTRLLTELKRSGELGQKWYAHYNRIRAEMLQRG